MRAARSRVRAGRLARRGRLAPRVDPASGLRVDDLAHCAKQRRRARVAAAVREVERVVEIGRVLSLGVLQDRFQLVERLHRLRLLRRRALVFVPQRQDFVAQRRIEHARERQQIGALVRALVGMRVGADRRHVAAQRLAEIVNHAHLQHLEHVEPRQFVGERDRHQAQPPAVLGRALGAARRRVRAPQHALQALRFAQELKPRFDLLNVHVDMTASGWRTIGARRTWLRARLARRARVSPRAAR
ncbi:metal-dependent phosphohydrolase domain protein [Burkholderia mallei]|nr:metal-dependent phosphohydrolase domain protein [Burkholderia mallei]